MTTTTLPSTTCPQDGRPATRYAFGTTTNYLSCANGHVFPVEVTEPPEFVPTGNTR